jgi:anti-sigma factor ChrR (cupin superfamily)
MRIPGLVCDGELDALPWRATRFRGVHWLLLSGGAEGAHDARARPGATVLIRMEPGCAYAPHRHVGTEDVLVLRGGYQDELGIHRQGDYVHYPAGSAHAPRALGDPAVGASAGNPACVLFACAPAGIELFPEP